MKRFLCTLLAISILTTSCANVKNYQRGRQDAFVNAQKELNEISDGCRLKTAISPGDVISIQNVFMPLSKRQYEYVMCLNGAKYIAFENYFQDKTAWSEHLRKDIKTLRNLYHRKITKRQADAQYLSHEMELQRKEDAAIAETIKQLEAKDQKGKDAAAAGLAILAVIAILAVAANHGGSSGNSYAGNCACPYDLDAAGHQCGARSAYSRSGGASPQCY